MKNKIFFFVIVLLGLQSGIVLSSNTPKKLGLLIKDQQRQERERQRKLLQMAPRFKRDFSTEELRRLNKERSEFFLFEEDAEVVDNQQGEGNNGLIDTINDKLVDFSGLGLLDGSEMKKNIVLDTELNNKPLDVNRRLFD